MADAILDARWARANHVHAGTAARQQSPIVAAGAAASAGTALCCSSALPRVLVWGQGAAGSTVGAKLQSSGEASVAFAPEQGCVNGVGPQGSKLRGQWPVIIFNNTSRDTRAEAVALEQHLAPGGFVVSFREQRELAMIVGYGNVVSAEEAFTAQREGTHPRVRLSEMDGQVSSSRVVALQAIFDRGLGFEPRAHSLL